jgi:hypothetical protein
MRETVRSLRLYFILSGLAELWLQSMVLISNLRSTISAATIAAAVFGIVGLSFSLAFLYVGAFLPALLRTSSDRIVMLLYASAGWLVVSSAPVFFLSTDRVWAVVGLVLGLLIIWYLLRNVRRLTLEAQNMSSTT